VKQLWVWREIDAPAELLWALISDVEQWPQWGPSVAEAALDGASLERGATGTVTTALGIDLNFEITDHVEGRSWGWKVAGIPATEHCVRSLGPDRCRVGFGVPWVVAPYLAVCEIALRRLEALATKAKADQ